MNDSFFESNEYYLVDTFNGEVKKNKLTFDIINNSKYELNNAKEVASKSKTKELDSITGEEYYSETIYQGFIKSSIDSYKDDLDIINSEIADLFDIDASKVYRVETDDNFRFCRQI